MRSSEWDHRPSVNGLRYAVGAAMTVALALASVGGGTASGKAAPPSCSAPWGMLGPDRKVIDLPTRLALYKQFHLGWVRVNADIPPSGSKGLTSVDDIADLQRAGLRVFLTVSDPALERDNPPPDALRTFAASLSGLLREYHPAMIAVENEADGSTDTASPGNYLAELKVACAVAHRASVQCTDSGMTSKMLIALVINEHLLKGDETGANHYARYLRLWFPMHLQLDPTGDDLRAILRHANVRRARTIVADLRLAGADRVDIHWYVRPNGRVSPADQADLLRQVVTMMQTVSGLPIASGEVGLDKPHGDSATADPAPFVSMLASLDQLGVAPAIIWNPGSGLFSANPNSMSLVDASGGTLPLGRAFLAQFAGTSTGACR